MTMALPKLLIDRLSGIVQIKQAAIQYGPIGIDFGRNGLRLAQFRNNHQKLELHASAMIPYNDQLSRPGRQTRALLKKLFREHGFVGHDVVTCIQPKDTKIMMMSYMYQPGKSDDELIVQRIAERVDDNIEDYVIDYMMVRPVNKDGQERSVLVAMAQRDLVVNYLEQLRKAGLKVKVLEIEPTAIRRLVSVRHGHENSANLMTVSMGYAQTYITVLSGRRLIYERDINFGEKQLIEVLCEELDLDENEARTMLVRDEAGLTPDLGQDNNSAAITDAMYGVLKPMFMELVEDINSALVYAASETRGLPVKHVYLTNLVATWNGIEHFVDSMINVPVSVLMPFEGFDNTAAFEADSDPRGVVVTGMALHGMTEAG